MTSSNYPRAPALKWLSRSQPNFRPLRRGDLQSETIALARSLIGTVLVRETEAGTIAGRIVETEAYLPGVDPASHAFRGRTNRNATMFREHGYAYVYFIYGRSFCLNVTSEDAGLGAAVLVRSVEPLLGLDIMARHRGTATARDLARGPGRLAQAFAIDRSLDGRDMLGDGDLRLARIDDEPSIAIGVSRRIGLTKAAELPLRFFARGSEFLSGPRSLSDEESAHS
jgi:DNA-3-methyladenine glycosylase